MSQDRAKTRLASAGLHLAFVMAVAWIARPACAASPGITGTLSGSGPVTASFNLDAEGAFISQPDGQMVYSWGYGCLTPPGDFLPHSIGGAKCSSMQIPGPTLIVTEGDTVSVTLTNNLPAAAGNTSILFPGFAVTATGGEAGLLTKEAVHSSTVTYTFDTTGKAGTHSYYSGTQADLQVEMGLHGALIIVPKVAQTACATRSQQDAISAHGGLDFRLATSAYDHPSTCYDREYLFQFSEMDPSIHRQAEDQKDRECSNHAGCMAIRTENYHPAYFMINGRSMPDDMDPNYAVQYPHQPYNGNPHMHPGELVLLRIIGQGRWQHPFHEHGNHVRVLARDGNLLLSKTDSTKLAGPLLFTTTTTPGQTMDAIFYWTGKGLNWDVYGHGYAGDDSVCVPDADGYYTSNTSASNYYEWCADHDKGLESNPTGLVKAGGPVTLPDANILANGPWYGGSPYLGPDAAGRAVGPTPIPPSGTVANDPGSEAGFAYMWHSHNEREITTNNAFPGGMMMMMLVDPHVFVIDESK
jgi:FtsP/CotA-like multicopper oxidase with cupredoxin domain